jgi:hypothetical protein
VEKIGNQKIWSYFNETANAKDAKNEKIRAGAGHHVQSYFELAKKVAELQYLNRDHILLFRGQANDHRTSKGNTTLKPSLFRLDGKRLPSRSVLAKRFGLLHRAELALVERYSQAGFLGRERLQRHRILRWAILQHYEVCPTPLLDVTHSLRIAASFASRTKGTGDAYVFVLGVPNLSGAVTASSEASLQIVRLSSACPPDAVRPHVQEGYLLGEYPEIADIEGNIKYRYHEMDFARRLVAKFKFEPTPFWHSPNFQPAPEEAMYPKEHRDALLAVTTELKTSLIN